MRINFPEISDDLTEFFGASQGRALHPTDLSPEIIPTHRIHAFRLLRAAQISNLVGAAGATQVLSAIVPVDRYWYVFGAGISHNDPIARDTWIELQLGDSVSLQTILALPTNTRFGIRGSVIVPPRWRLAGRVVAIAAANVVTLTFGFLELNLQDSAPH